MTDGHAGVENSHGPVALIVGPGDRFLSGVSYYTALLAAALTEHGPLAVMLLRELCPRAFYPGRARVGSTEGVLPLPAVPVFNGLDWFWGVSAIRAFRFWRRTRPRVVILQWWTCTVLHSYLALAWLSKRAGARVVIEFHELQDVGEAKVPLMSRYTRAGMQVLLRRVDAVVVHSEFDRCELEAAYPRIAQLPIQVIPHGPYGHHGRDSIETPMVRRKFSATQTNISTSNPLRVLIFGVVRPYKGHAELVCAIRLLVSSGLDIHVSVVGEVWQGYREPLTELQEFLPADRLTIVDRYVSDDEVSEVFAASDLVVLPYRRSSASGPLHIAMSCGLPVVTTSVGGLVDAAAGYSGAVLVPPGDPDALAEGIRNALPLVGEIHADPHSWGRSATRYAALLQRIDANWGDTHSTVHSRSGRVGAPGVSV